MVSVPARFYIICTLGVLQGLWKDTAEQNRFAFAFYVFDEVVHELQCFINEQHMITYILQYSTYFTDALLYIIISAKKFGRILKAASNTYFFNDWWSSKPPILFRTCSLQRREGNICSRVSSATRSRESAVYGNFTLRTVGHTDCFSSHACQTHEAKEQVSTLAMKEYTATTTLMCANKFHMSARLV